jgi:hypothetical protein
MTRGQSDVRRSSGCPLAGWSHDGSPTCWGAVGRAFARPYVTLLKEAVQASPHDMGYPFGMWTLDRLREHLARRTRVILSPAYLSHLMHEHDIVYRRPKHGMSHLRDPQEYNEKKAFLEFVKKGRCAPRPALTCSTSTSVRFTSTRP